MPGQSQQEHQQVTFVGHTTQSCSPGCYRKEHPSSDSGSSKQIPLYTGLSVTFSRLCGRISDEPTKYVLEVFVRGR